MKKDLVIVGYGSYPIMVKKYIESDMDRKIIAFSVEKKCIVENYLDNLEVIPLEEIEKKYPPERVDLILAIGYREMHQIRKAVYQICKDKGYHFENYIHSSVIMPPNMMLGEGNIVLEAVIFEMGVSIGNANLFFGGSMVGHDSFVGNFNTFSVRSMTAGNAVITEKCFIGVGALVKDGVTLGEGTLAGAGAYVAKDTEAYSVIVPPKSYVLEEKRSTDFL